MYSSVVNDDQWLQSFRNRDCDEAVVGSKKQFDSVQGLQQQMVDLVCHEQSYNCRGAMLGRGTIERGAPEVVPEPLHFQS